MSVESEGGESLTGTRERVSSIKGSISKQVDFSPNREATVEVSRRKVPLRQGGGTKSTAFEGGVLLGLQEGYPRVRRGGGRSSSLASFDLDFSLQATPR